jgi:hypothetical protein
MGSVHLHRTLKQSHRQAQEETLFHLHVEFSGPCLFVLEPEAGGDIKQATVLMPDGRRSKHPDPKHLDGRRAEHHVGFVRLDLADMDLPFPTGGKEAQPKYELVHRFDGQVLSFGDGLALESMDVSKLHLPNFNKIAPGTLEPFPNLLGENPADQLLMRMELRGGVFHSEPKRVWEFSTVLNPGGEPYEDEFASTVIWKRKIENDHLTVTVSDFRGNREAEFPLGKFAEGEIVTLAVGNLCSINPLDWDDLPPHPVTAIDDDFKWLYQLLRTKGKPTLELPKDVELPTPKLKNDGGETGDEACMGGFITTRMPTE